MSRHYQVTRGEVAHRKMHPKKRSEKWEEARAKRRAKRQRLPEQPRNEEGYIVKEVVIGSTVTKVLHDPGEIDRELYLRQRRQRAKESWEAPDA